MSHETGCRCWDCMCKLPEEFSKLLALHFLLIDERNTLKQEIADLRARRADESAPTDILRMVRDERDRVRKQRDQAWADAKADRQTVLTLQRGMQALLDSTWARPTTPLTPFGEMTITHHPKAPGVCGTPGCVLCYGSLSAQRASPPNPNYRSNP